MVDEYQDTNMPQYRAVMQLASGNGNICVVGDDDQSIYHFRGARPGIMLNFEKDYPGSGRILLDINYRCSGSIIRASSKLIAHNVHRFPKEIRTPNPPGSPVSVRTFRTPAEQYRTTAETLRKTSAKEDALEKTAVLFRTNLEAEGLIRILMEYQIPFTMHKIY